MKIDKNALKAQLVEQYTRLVDELLEQVKDEKTLHLTEIEDLAIKLRQEVSASVTETLVSTENAKQAVDVLCPSCAGRMHYKGRKSKWLKTRTGDVRVERAYYYCESCHRGHFPPR